MSVNVHSHGTPPSAVAVGMDLFARLGLVCLLCWRAVVLLEVLPTLEALALVVRVPAIEASRNSKSVWCDPGGVGACLEPHGLPIWISAQQSGQFVASAFLPLRAVHLQ